MRLIDADEFFRNYPELAIEPYINASTIEAIPTELHEKIMDKTTGELLECQSHLRPQGEWTQSETDRIYHTNNWECSNCHSIYVIWNNPSNHNYNYCPNCGASMKPKANQLRDCENCIHHSDNGCEVWECEFEKRSVL